MRSESRRSSFSRYPLRPGTMLARRSRMFCCDLAFSKNHPSPPRFGAARTLRQEREPRHLRTPRSGLRLPPVERRSDHCQQHAGRERLADVHRSAGVESLAERLAAALWRSGRSRVCCRTGRRPGSSDTRCSHPRPASSRRAARGRSPARPATRGTPSRSCAAVTSYPCLDRIRLLEFQDILIVIDDQNGVRQEGPLRNGRRRWMSQYNKEFPQYYVRIQGSGRSVSGSSSRSRRSESIPSISQSRNQMVSGRARIEPT